MPADIHLLPHAGCIHRPLLIGERRFLGLFCPDEPPRTPPFRGSEHCRLCGFPNPRHHVRYRIRWYLQENQVRNLARHAQCPRCALKVRNQILIEVRRLRDNAAEDYTLAEFASQLRSSDWSEMHVEYRARRKKGDTPHPLKSR